MEENNPTISHNSDEQLPQGEEVQALSGSSARDLWADCFSLEADDLDIDLDPFEEDLEDSMMDMETQQLNLAPVSFHIEQPQGTAVLVDGMGERLDPTVFFTAQDEAAENALMPASDIIKAQSDLHGITTGMSNLGVGDTSWSDLQIMDYELSKLPPEKTAAYSRALRECPGLVSDKRKMAFLQREDNNPALAAVRFAFHWELRLVLFGPERCFLPMTLNGAMKDEATNIVERRIFQLLPVPDTAGRAILFVDPSHRNYAVHSIEQEMMSLWYLLEVAMEDPEVQRRGFVLVFTAKYVELKHFSRTALKWFAQIMAAVPIHHRAAHVCYPNAFVHFVIAPVAKLLSGKENRQRSKLHYGSTDEVLKTLEAVCLPRDRLPTDVGGDITLDMAKWVSERRALEESRPDPRHTLQMIAEKVVAKVIGNRKSPPAKSGRKSDPRMTRAIKVRLANPNLSPLYALEQGGFIFDRTDESGNLMDADNIALVQRQNQLARRIRQIEKDKERQQRQPKSQSAAAPADIRTSSSSGGGSSST